jgi:hypothetical protein
MTSDNKIKSEVILVEQQFITFELIGSLIIWYTFFVKVNFVSKLLHSLTMHIDLSTVNLKEVLLYFEKYRDSGFTNYLVKTK